ncbi:Mth938-like domain-containing protein [Candidatus Nitrosacidococcus tergens]|uniref:Xcc1710-like domain-containing protein n=1 Tax=Candidatus Nitrosacidococcus tergens TaxID=553981 RepID=A0A7G1Q9B6_9GAMM|nr:Mth938-like domain-containing protein [Candidatus Nitrosacidococcus tergens]CAB1275879.1 conserved protein of unknown function [Candidatus Nitrosacidococcus tergens]
MKFGIDERINDSYIVKSYGIGYIEILSPISLVLRDGEDEYLQEKRKQIIHHSVILTRDKVREWTPRTFDELKEGYFEIFLDIDPEVILLGTGNNLFFPPPSLFKKLFDHRIGVEFMNTAAACRTYNILVNENRRVAAALLI